MSHKEGITFEVAFEIQQAMQREVFGNDVRLMPPVVLAAWIKENVFWATDELHELIQEVPAAKPWANTETIHKDAAFGELIDHFHFMMNILDALGKTPRDLLDGYVKKQKRNVARQKSGYTGEDKCPGCRRAWDDIDAVREGSRTRLAVTNLADETTVYCGRPCYSENGPQEIAKFKETKL